VGRGRPPALREHDLAARLRHLVGAVGLAVGRRRPGVRRLRQFHEANVGQEVGAWAASRCCGDQADEGAACYILVDQATEAEAGLAAAPVMKQELDVDVELLDALGNPFALRFWSRTPIMRWSMSTFSRSSHGCEML
jgi:hypothetical protein